MGVCRHGGRDTTFTFHMLDGTVYHKEAKTTDVLNHLRRWMADELLQVRVGMFPGGWSTTFIVTRNICSVSIVQEDET